MAPSRAAAIRAYVRVQGPDAVDYLNRMLSNDVPESGSVDALLLTAKARVIAPLLVWRRGADDVLLLTEPELGETVRAQLTRMRFAAQVRDRARAAHLDDRARRGRRRSRHPEPRLRRAGASRCSTARSKATPTSSGCASRR